MTLRENNWHRSPQRLALVNVVLEKSILTLSHISTGLSASITFMLSATITHEPSKSWGLTSSKGWIRSLQVRGLERLTDVKQAKAMAHTANTSLYTEAMSVDLGQRLTGAGSEARLIFIVESEKQFHNTERAESTGPTEYCDS